LFVLFNRGSAELGRGAKYPELETKRTGGEYLLAIHLQFSTLRITTA